MNADGEGTEETVGVKLTKKVTLMVPCMTASLCFKREKASRARFRSTTSALCLLDENADAVIPIICATSYAHIVQRAPAVRVEMSANKRARARVCVCVCVCVSRFQTHPVAHHHLDHQGTVVDHDLHLVTSVLAFKATYTDYCSL